MRRYATPRVRGLANRGLKPTATITRSLRDQGGFVAWRWLIVAAGFRRVATPDGSRRFSSRRDVPMVAGGFRRLATADGSRAF